MGKLLFLMMTLISSIDAKADVVVSNAKCSAEVMTQDEASELLKYCKRFDEFYQDLTDWGPVFEVRGTSCWYSCRDNLRNEKLNN